jgi:glycosyltransferase involved in cell wall biosynthesis
MTFASKFWSDIGPTINNKPWHCNPTMIADLMRQRIDVLMVGGPWDSVTGALVSAFGRRRVGIAWFEGNTKSPGRRSTGIRGVKRWLLSQFDLLAVPGEEGARLARLLWGEGDDMPRCVRLPNLVEEGRFSVDRDRPDRAMHRNEWCRELGLPVDRKVAIWPARLIPAKGVCEFLSVIEPRMLLDWSILIAGDGPLRETVGNTITSRALGGHITVRHNIPYARMPLAYLHADLFLLPSLSDPNPLSVIEAMHSGLPLLVSKRIGNYPEALQVGVNGWGIDPSSADEIRTVCSEAFNCSTDKLKEMGRASARLAGANWNTGTAITNFVDAVLERL